MKTLVIVFLLIAFTGPGLLAQVPARRDSVKKIAQRDAIELKLSKAELKNFKKYRSNYNDDFFEPDKTTTPDTTLLRDSVYVKAFRLEAYKRYKHKRTAAHYVIVGEVFLTSIFLILLVAALATGKNVR